MSIPVTVNGYTFNFISDPTSPNGWDIAPASEPPLGIDQVTLWNEGEAAAQIVYEDDAFYTYWYAIESIADEYDPSGYAAALAAYEAAVGGYQYTSVYAPGVAAWETFASAVLTLAETYDAAGATAAYATLQAAYNTYEAAYNQYQQYYVFLAARSAAIAQQVANPYIVNGQPSATPL